MAEMDKGFLIGFAAGVITIAFIALAVIACVDRDWREASIEAGAGQYNSETGEFEWNKTAVPNNSSETTP